MNKWRKLPKPWFFIPILLWLVVFAVFDAKATDFRVGTILASNHPFSNASNEQHEGVYLAYNGFIVGTYINSESTDDRRARSNLVAYEREFARWNGIELSYTAGMANGYQDTEDFGEYRAWASVNAKISYFKVWYAYRVVAAGLEYRF